MPTVTNFGDVVTQGNTTATGNLTVQGTGTSSFTSASSAVTMAGTLAVTGVTTHTSNIIPNSDLGCGIGTATQRMGNVYSANVNVYTTANIVTANINFSNVSNIATFQNSVFHLQNTFLTGYTATTGTIVPTTTGISGLGSSTLLFANSYLQTANIGSSTAQMSMNVTGNVYVSNAINVTNVFSVTTNASYLNVISWANIASLNVFVGANTTYLNVMNIANVNVANVLTANIQTSNLVTANVQNLNVSTGANVSYLNVSFISNTNVANILTANIQSSNLVTANIQNLNVSTGANTTYLNVMNIANVNVANVLTANIQSSNLVTANVQNLNVSTGANVSYLNVSFISNTNVANILTANIQSSNLVTANIQNLNVSTGANVSYLNVTFISNTNVANILTANIQSSNLVTANVQNLNVSVGANTTYLNVMNIANVNVANILTTNVLSANIVTANVQYLNVSTGANVSYLNVSFISNTNVANILTANVQTSNLVTANVQNLNVSTGANVTTLFVQNYANILNSNIVTAFHSNINVSSNANLFNTNIFTANITSSLNVVYGLLTANFVGNASGVSNLNLSNVNAGTLPFSVTPGLGAAGISINGITGSAGQYITATGTGSGLQWGGPTATVIWAQVPGFVSPPIYYATANVGVGGPYSSMSWGVGSSSVNQYPGTPFDVYGGAGSFSNLSDATYTGTIRIQQNAGSWSANGGLEFKTGTNVNGSGHRIVTAQDPTTTSTPLIFQIRSQTKTWSNAMVIECQNGATSGYVGIGTMVPLYQLHIYQPSASATLGGVLVETSQATQQSTFTLKNAAAGTCVFYLNGATPSDGPAASATLRNNAGDLRLACASQTPLIYLQNSNGSVGINTSNPGAYNLNLYGTVAGSSTSVGALTNSGGSLNLSTGIGTSNVFIGVAGTYYYAFGSSALAPVTGGGVTLGTDASRFGAVFATTHVGTNYYGAIAGSNTISCTTVTASSTLSCTSITSSGGTIQTSYAQGTNAPNAGQAYFYNPTNALNQDASCAVRIAGSTARNAYYGLDVNGVAGYSFGITGASQNLVFRASWDMSTGTLFTMDRSGNFTAAASVICNSDKRIKTEIEEIPDALEKIKKVSGYTFKRTDIDIPRQAGVLAQELIEVLPEAVIADDKGMYSVAYGNITALLIQALKEETAKREALELRLSRFEEFFELAHMGL